jgi:hypothetical protein
MPIVWLVGLGQLKKSNDLIGNQTHKLPVCSIVPQWIDFRTNPISTTVMNVRYMMDSYLFRSKNYAIIFPFKAGRNSIAHIGCPCRQTGSQQIAVKVPVSSRWRQRAGRQAPRHLSNPITQTLTFSTDDNKRHSLSPRLQNVLTFATRD